MILLTLKEIAAEAGVSISTVSRVINKNSTKVASPEVQTRIREIAARNGYIPNVTAQCLKEGAVKRADARQKAIACIFARTPDSVNNPFFIEIARSLELTAYRHNFVVKHSFTALDVQSPSILQSLSEEQLEGAVILGRCNNDLLHYLRKYFQYVIYTGLNEFDSKYDQVVCDGYAVSIAVMKYLYSLGHRNIAYIGETENEVRYNGYLDALKQLGLPFRKEYIVNVLQTAEEGYNGVNRLLEKVHDATAIFCADDSTAIGALRALHDHHISVPNDVSVISINGNETTQFLTPPLTTVQIPAREMGDWTAKVLIDRMQGGHDLPIRIEVPFKLLERQSCAPLKK